MPPAAGRDRDRRRRDRHGPSGRLAAARYGSVARRAEPVRFPCRPLRDRLSSRQVLRLRGRFRGRRGFLAFLAVMGPGLSRGSPATTPAGSRPTASGRLDGCRCSALPDHDRHPGDRPGDGGAARRRHRAGAVRPHPRPVRRAPTAFAMLVLLIANVANTVAEFSGAAASLELFGVSRYFVGAARRRRHLGAGPLRQLPHRGAGFPRVRRLRDLHRVGDPGRPDWGGRPGARHAAARPDAGPAAPDGRGRRHDDHPVHAVLSHQAVADKGIGEEELRLEQADALGGSVWTNVIAIFIVVAAAARSAWPPARSHRRPMRRRPSSRSPAGWPSPCSRSVCSGRASSPRRSCRCRRPS